MENKLEKRYSYLVKKTQADIAKKEAQIEKLSKELKEAIAQFDTYQIVTFVPGYVRRIEEANAKLKVLEEKMELLAFICDEE